MLGNHSFEIYLMHAPFFVAGLVGVCLSYSPLPTVVICICVLYLGLVVPMLISEFIIKRVPLLNTLILGEKLKRNADKW